jgi:hypothetical protein
MKDSYWNGIATQQLWWNSERLGVITRQLQAAKCLLSCKIFLHIFILLENLRLQYVIETFVRFACYSLGP